jgi:serine/threonine protein kinase
MPAKLIPIGKPAHDNESQAIRFSSMAFPMPTPSLEPLARREERVIYEVDAIVVAPHAIFCVEIKSWRGRIAGTDHDWYIPHPVKSPLGLNRKTAQVLKGMLTSQSHHAGQVWVQGLVFLSSTTDVALSGLASRDAVHTRKSILAAVQDKSLILRVSGRQSITPTTAAEGDLLRLLTGYRERGVKPVRRVREYEVRSTIARTESFSEYEVRHTLTEMPHVLRIYPEPPLASDEQRARLQQRARWEAQVLGRLGRIAGVVRADPPFLDEAGVVIPFEYFEGITLTTWIETYGPSSKDKNKADLSARVKLWLTLARILDEVHHQGVVHRLLRPEVVLVKKQAVIADANDVRITAFDLAKQLNVDTTIRVTPVADDRLVSAAPEVVASFTSAVPASDQFSLGALLAHLLVGKPLFESTQKLMHTRGLAVRVRDLAPRIPLSLDEAVCRMLALRPADRYASLAEAITAVEQSLEPHANGTRTLPGMGVAKAKLDPEDLQPGQRIPPDYEVLSKLGAGGMAWVYAARHLVSGRTRVSRSRAPSVPPRTRCARSIRPRQARSPQHRQGAGPEQNARGQPDLVLERVGGESLRQWSGHNRKPNLQTQRRLAEDLLAGLDYLEQRGVIHKDLKPDNLLVDDGRLTIIDFSLAAVPVDAAYGGTALYRDPASSTWSAATDRYAAALCLFEIYAGRHAFDGQVPEPGAEPAVREEDIDPPGLAPFFKKALNAVPERRFPSAKAMREALLAALVNASM